MKYIKRYTLYKESKGFKTNEANKENGIIVYHGTPNKFDAFEYEKSSIYNLYGRGFYFTDSLKIAKGFLGGILDKKGTESHIKKCKLLVDKIYDFDEDISNAELLEYKQILLKNYDDFWFKHIYSILREEDFNLVKMNKRICNRKNLLYIKNKLINNDNTYSKDVNKLSRLDVFGILTDDFHSIWGKKHIVDYLKTKYDCFKLKQIGSGLSHYKTKIAHNIYVVFTNNKIQYLEDIKKTNENWYGDKDKTYETSIEHKEKFLVDLDYTLNWVEKHNPTFKTDDDEMSIDKIEHFYDYDSSKSKEWNIENFKNTVKESAISKIKEYMKVYKSTKKNGFKTIYRQISVDKIEDLKTDEIGLYWSFDSVRKNNNIREFDSNNIHLLITGEAKFDQINWGNGLDNYIYFGDAESEIKLLPNNKIKILDIEVLKIRVYTKDEEKSYSSQLCSVVNHSNKINVYFTNYSKYNSIERKNMEKEAIEYFNKIQNSVDKIKQLLVR